MKYLEPPFNMIITGPTCCGKTKYVMDLLTGLYYRKFEYIVFICPTFMNNKTYNQNFIFLDDDVFVLPIDHDSVDEILKIVHEEFKNTNTLVVLDDCASSKNVKKRSTELVKLGFSARHDKLSIWVLTQQYTSISKPFRENIGMLVLFYTPSKTDNTNIMKEYGMEFTRQEVSDKIKQLKETPFSKLIFRLRHPYEIVLV